LDVDRARSVLEKDPPDRVKYRAMDVLKVNKLMDYLSGKEKDLPDITRLGDVIHLLPKEFLPKVLEKIPLEGSSVFEDLAKRMDKKYALEILNRIPNPEHASVAVTELFKKLSQVDVQKFIDSESGAVRRSVARRIDKSRLPEMIDDISSDVRRTVAERIDPEHLPKMMRDDDPKVRRRVAERISPEYLEQMRKDKSVKVRGVVKSRLGLASNMSASLLRVARSVAAGRPYLAHVAARLAAIHGLDPVESLRVRPDDWSAQTMEELHSVLPFIAPYDNDLPLSVLSWVALCEKRGLITDSEYFRLERAIKKTEGMDY